MAYYPQDNYPEYQNQFYGYGQPPHAHYHQHHRIPPGSPYYNPQQYHHHQYYQHYNQYQGEGYPPGYGYGQYNGAAPQQPQQPRAGDSRKGLNIVDPKEREQQRAAAEANGPAPSPTSGPKKTGTALPIKDPVTRQPINLDQPQAQAAPAPQPQAPPAEPAAQPAASPQAPQKKKAIPILDPVTRKEVTAANPTAATSATAAPTATASETSASTPSQQTVSSSSASAPAPADGAADADASATKTVDVPTTADAPAAAEPEAVESSTPQTPPEEPEPDTATTPVPGPETSAEQASDTPAEPPKASVPTAAPETLVFAPGATWGVLPKLPKQDSADPYYTGAASHNTSSSVEEEKSRAPALVVKEDSDSEYCTSGSDTEKPTSSISASGRRVYDFEFLLSISTKAPPPPENLRTFEIYMHDARNRKSQATTPDSKSRDRRGFGNKVATPTYGSNKAAGSFDGDMRSKMGKVFVPGPPGGNKQTFENLSNRAETAFNLKNSGNINAEEKILKKVRGILNRITPEKYAVLFDQLWAELYNEEDKTDESKRVMRIVPQVIHTVFDIALDQPKFSYLYADICYHLCRKIQVLKDQQKEQDAGDSKESEDPNKQSATLKEFRRILLNTCQERFEEGSRHQQTVIPDDAPEEERERIQREEYRYKARSLGNIKFISELFKRSLLSERIMHIVIKILLIDTDHSDPRNFESMETLHEMLQAVGKKLDRAQAKQHMDNYFEKMEEIAQTHPVKRIRFLILNIVELRKANWVSRADQKTTVPEDDGRRISKTYSWNGERVEPQRVTSANRPDRGGMGKDAGKGRQQSVESDGFKTVGKAAKNSVWNSNPPSTPTSLPSPGSGFGGRSQENKASPQRSNREPEPKATNSAPVDDGNSAAAQKGPPPLKDEQIAAKARGLLEEFAADPEDKENALAVLREEIPTQSYAQFITGMILGAVSQNKREKERADLPKLCALYQQEELVEEKHMQQAFTGVMEKAKREELWVDVPRLWQNIGVVLGGSFEAKIVDLEVLAPMAEVLANGDEEAQSKTTDFLSGVIQCLEKEEFSAEFDGEKAGRIIAAVTKAATKKKTKAKPLATLDEFKAAVDKITFQ
jgi:translation initiation factor 4G|uniref:MI domain-containing protein n=1 Tax=Eutreptiella gymnastica TaxID=73025 RepID=A0A7S4FUQ9_9EUGL|mmetsp:Transcript_53209/g.87427  ORF Transcript_53209/g.87427 Transcript_53209/m.87427 type:complete len:1101 (-) Transcript_53209:4291-7593(-)